MAFYELFKLFNAHWIVTLALRPTCPQQPLVWTASTNQTDLKSLFASGQTVALGCARQTMPQCVVPMATPTAMNASFML